MVDSLKWSVSHAVFVTEIDDEHKEIFEALSGLQKTLSGEMAEVQEAIKRLVACITGHFEHEERLMRAARYVSLRWHRDLHRAARRRVVHLVGRIEEGDAAARRELVEYLTRWLHDHTRMADQMMAAALRNHRRFMCTLTFEAGTKAKDACRWTRADGGPLKTEVESRG